MPGPGAVDTSYPASVIIVGGGIGGWTAATALRDGGYAGEVTIVEAEPLAYDRPPLSKGVLVTGADLASLAFASADEFAAQRIALVAGAPAVRLDPGAVTLGDGRELRADHLVLAAGAAPRRPDFPGAEAAVTLRAYRDVEQIRAAAAPGARLVVLGGGFIGAEAAASLRTIGAEVVLADRSPVPGVRVLGPTLAGCLHALHAANGVDVRVAVIESIEHPSTHPHPRGGDSAAAAHARRRDTASSRGLAGGGGPLVVRLTDGTTVQADLVLAGIGMAGPTPLPGAEHADTVLAPADHWDDARLDGHDAAGRILGTEPPPRGAPWYWSDRYGHHLEVVGRLVGERQGEGEGEGEEIVRWAEPGRPAAVFRLEGDQLVGAASIDDPNTVRAARRLIDQGIPVTATALRDPTISLRDLLRAAR